jgi:predicted signal transduction protein with EAL and GGDEF domain
MGNLETPETILERADSALYAAKQAGRNRTFLHDGRNVELNTAPVRTASHSTTDEADAAAPADEHAVESAS